MSRLVHGCDRFRCVGCGEAAPLLLGRPCPSCSGTEGYKVTRESYVRYLLGKPAQRRQISLLGEPIATDAGEVGRNG
jgi:hypothetical protein